MIFTELQIRICLAHLMRDLEQYLYGTLLLKYHTKNIEEYMILVYVMTNQN